MDPASAKMALQLAATLGRSRGARYLVVGLLALAVAVGGVSLFGPWILTTEIAANLRNSTQQAGDGGSCSSLVGNGSQPAGGFSSEQIGNAKIIWTVAQQMLEGERGAVIGIATAMQESGLRNLPYGDLDSVGLFQQRGNWGSRATRLNPVKASRLFFRALNKVPGWRTLPVAAAAQSVQRSAFPDAYAKWEQPAIGLVALIKSKLGPGASGAIDMIGSGMCGPSGAANCPGSGLPTEYGLTPDALRVLRCVAAQWSQLKSFRGIGDQGAMGRDHQQGRAVDVMIPGAGSAAGNRLGAAVAGWLVDHQLALGVQYVVWNNKIWNVDHADKGWQSCTGQADCSNGPDDTGAAVDHVHVTVFGDQAGQDATLGPIVLPVDHYVLTARFGQCSSHWANCHTGLDFAAPEGTPIRAVMNGRVVWTGWGGPYGNLTKIQHAGNLQTWYAHQSAIDVTVGQNVTAGQIIGRIGSTGNATGPHVHLEVRSNGTPVDPQQWLTAHGVKP